MIKIAFTGVAGSGKGTCVAITQELFQEELKIGSFAKPIKEFFRRLCAMEDTHLYGDLKETDLTFVVTPDQFNEAAEYYYASGLDDLVSFDRMWFRFCEVLAPNFDMNGPTWSLHSISSRRLQQLFGTEVMRSIYDDIWIDYALSKEYNLIDDLRFPNEATALKDAGYFLVRIIGKDSRVSSTDALHSSELSINKLPVDAEVDNYFEEYTSDSIIELKNRLLFIFKENKLI